MGCTAFLEYLARLDSARFSHRNMAEYVALSTSAMMNRARALIEVDFRRHYPSAVKVLQKAIKLCAAHQAVEWRISFLDRTFRVFNKMVTDYCRMHCDTTPPEVMQQEFALRSQGLFCLLTTDKLMKSRDSNKENQAINGSNAASNRGSPRNSKSSALSFWDIAHQYIRYVKSRYTATDVIRFRKMTIELWLQCDAAPIAANQYSIEFINLCIDYMISIGESPAKLKVEILHKIMAQFERYTANLERRAEYAVAVHVVAAVAVSRMALQHDVQYLPTAIDSWSTALDLLRRHHRTVSHSEDDEVWKLLSKSMRNVPHLARYIEDAFPPQKVTVDMVALLRSMTSAVDQLFEIWRGVDSELVAPEKVKNANHRLFDTLITVLSVEQKCFLNVPAPQSTSTEEHAD